MKPLIGLTQRVTQMSASDEKQDSLAQDWGRFMATVGLPWVALPNRPEEALELVHRLDVRGVIFTGGDDVGTFPERDTTERVLFEWASAQGRQIIGICRGFQMLCLWLGGQVLRIDRALHVNTTHALSLVNGSVIERNSFHNWGIHGDVPTLRSVAVCIRDQTLEMAYNSRILGIMWHPERDEANDFVDSLLIRNHLTINQDNNYDIMKDVFL